MQGGETDPSDGEDEENASGDEDLLEEHRSLQLQNQLHLVLHFCSLFFCSLPISCC